MYELEDELTEHLLECAFSTWGSGCGTYAAPLNFLALPASSSSSSRASSPARSDPALPEKLLLEKPLDSAAETRPGQTCLGDWPRPLPLPGCRGALWASSGGTLGMRRPGALAPFWRRWRPHPPYSCSTIPPSLFRYGQIPLTLIFQHQCQLKPKTAPKN